jgi:hypothetical protein
MKKEIKIDTIQLDKFNVMFVNSSPPRLEAKLEFDKQHSSQKLIFSLMEITHHHGFGCSPPFFGGREAVEMSFLIGTVVTSKRSVAKLLKRLHACLEEVVSFSESFISQLDFSNLNLSMFDDCVVGDVEKIITLRDQYYEGSWKKLKNALLEEGLEEAAQMTVALQKFEKINKKDLGLVSHKLNYVLDLLYTNKEKEPVFN